MRQQVHLRAIGGQAALGSPPARRGKSHVRSARVLHRSTRHLAGRAGELGVLCTRRARRQRKPGGSARPCEGKPAGAAKGDRRLASVFPRRTRTCRSNRPSRAAIASGRLCPAGRNRKRNRRGATASINASRRRGFRRRRCGFRQGRFSIDIRARAPVRSARPGGRQDAKVYESSEPAATSVATKDQEDFFTRRAEVLRAMLKSM
jgi:hypothetical protein